MTIEKRVEAEPPGRTIRTIRTLFSADPVITAKRPPWTAGIPGRAKKGGRVIRTIRTIRTVFFAVAAKTAIQRVAPGFHFTSSAPLALARRAATNRWSDRRFR